MPLSNTRHVDFEAEFKIKNLEKENRLNLSHLQDAEKDNQRIVDCINALETQLNITLSQRNRIYERIDKIENYLLHIGEYEGYLRYLGSLNEETSSS